MTRGEHLIASVAGAIGRPDLAGRRYAALIERSPAVFEGPSGVVVGRRGCWCARAGRGGIGARLVARGSVRLHTVNRRLEAVAMIVFGLILVGLAVLLAAGVAASSGNRATLDVFGVGLDTRTSVVFFIGVAAAAALLLGLWLSKAGLARGYRRRKEVRELRHQVQAAPAPMADSSSTRDDRDEDDEHDDTAEVAAGNDAAELGAESGTGKTTDGNEEAAPAGRHQAPQTEGAESTPGGKSENTEAAERKDDGGLRTVPRSGAD